MVRPAPLQLFSVAPITVARIEGKDVLMIHPEGRVHVPLLPGATSVTASFGILPDAYEAGSTDGVEFLIELLDESHEQILLDRHLDPRRQLGDRGTQRFFASLPAHSPGEIVFSVLPGPARDMSRDWSYWSSILVQ